MSQSTKQKITTNQANISTLQSEVAGLNQRIDNNFGSIDELNTKTSEQDSTILSLQQQISSNESEIANITQEFRGDIGDINALILQKENEVNTAFQAETENRGNAINLVQQSVDSEITLRNGQKYELDGRIATEESTRESADVQLG